MWGHLDAMRPYKRNVGSGLIESSRPFEDVREDRLQ